MNLLTRTTAPLLLLISGCAIDDPDELATATSELTDPGILAVVPGIPTPAGYGHYCSVTDPTNGGWALGALPSNDSQPCTAMSTQVGPGAVVQRAGLWATNGNNNVMVRCDGVLHYGRAFGASAITWIQSFVTSSNTNCVFTIAPTQLPAFGRPFLGSSQGTSVFDYHYTRLGWDVAEFGQVGSGKACSVDRTGAEKGTFAADKVTCVAVSTPGTFNANEPAYDWSMPLDAPIYAVADGIIRESYARNTASACNGSNQLELFLETQVGSGQYAEHFVAAYHHMNPFPNTANPSIAANVAIWGGKPMAPKNRKVKKGDVIAYNGTSGCSGGPHLDLMVFRLTNLTGARSYVFDTVNSASSTGVNGWQGITDPFGWAAPRGIDPLAYKLIGLGKTTGEQPDAIVDAGAFSINLWDTARMWVTDPTTGLPTLLSAFDALAHNGGNSF